MTKAVPLKIIDFFSSRCRFYLIGHEEPDGDCIASQLALARFLKRLGKEVDLFSPGPFIRPEILPYKSIFSRRIPASEGSGASKVDPVAVILDCSTIDRIGGDLAADISALETLVIDHHSSGSKFGDLRYIDSAAPSVTFLIWKVITAMNCRPSREEAELLLFGLCTDTGFFRHLEAGSAEVFQAVAALTAAGASPRECYRLIYGGRSLESRILTGRVLSRAEVFINGRIIVTYETLADKNELGIESRDSDSIYSRLQGVKGCHGVVFIREEGEGEYSVGLRSDHSLDVGAVAESFGGGGHRRAAGFTWHGSREQIKKRLLEMFARDLPPHRLHPRPKFSKQKSNT
jgi:phosphoesterase RecJ-like protein